MDEDFKLYLIAEVAYMKANPNESEEDLFPIAWYSSKNYKLKTEILAKSIKENKTVWELEELDLLLDNQ